MKHSNDKHNTVRNRNRTTMVSAVTTVITTDTINIITILPMCPSKLSFVLFVSFVCSVTRSFERERERENWLERGGNKKRTVVQMSTSVISPMWLIRSHSTTVPSSHSRSRARKVRISASFCSLTYASFACSFRMITVTLP